MEQEAELEDGGLSSFDGRSEEMEKYPLTPGSSGLSSLLSTLSSGSYALHGGLSLNHFDENGLNPWEGGQLSMNPGFGEEFLNL